MVFGGFLVRGLRDRLSRLTRHQILDTMSACAKIHRWAITTSRSAFFELITLEGASVDTIGSALSDWLRTILPEGKLIGQACDARSHGWGTGRLSECILHTLLGAPTRCRYAEGDVPKISQLLSELGGDCCCSHTREQQCSTRWLRVVFPEHQDNRVVALETISKRGGDSNSERPEAVGLFLEDSSLGYLFSGTLFHKSMAQVQMLLNRLQE